MIGTKSVIGRDGRPWSVREAFPFAEGPGILIFAHGEELRWSWGSPIGWTDPNNARVLLSLSRPFAPAV